MLSSPDIGMMYGLGLIIELGVNNKLVKTKIKFVGIGDATSPTILVILIVLVPSLAILIKQVIPEIDAELQPL